MLKRLIILISSIFWPYQLIATNNHSDILKFASPVVLLLATFFLFKKKSKYYILPIIFMPLFEPKLAIFPVLFLIIFAVYQKRGSKKLIAGLLMSLIVLTISWRGFVGQTIFQPDYERRQEIIRNTKLYDSIFLARMFHNKARVYIDKFNHNFFALIDPNNYFFGFAPRQIVENQNLNKFPFLALPFFIYGIWKINKHKQKWFIIISSLAALLNLSILAVFDKNDFLLWLPITLLLIHGVNKIDKKYPKKWVSFSFILFIIFSIPELIRILIQ